MVGMGTKQLHSVEGRGRCFIRVALCQKLISVPVEHLVKNTKLTQVRREGGREGGDPLAM